MNGFILNENGVLQPNQELFPIDDSKRFSLEKVFYIYVYMDPRKPGFYFWGDYVFPYEPFYIGKGKNDRVSFHLKEVMRGYKNIVNQHKNNKIKEIINETGYYPIYGKIIEGLNEEEAFLLEEIIINELKKYESLTNISQGGFGGDNWTNNPNKEEIRKKLSLACSGNKNGMFGKKQSEETKNKIGEKNRGRKIVFTEEHSKKIGIALKGKKKSDIHKKKLSEVNKILLDYNLLIDLYFDNLSVSEMRKEYNSIKKTNISKEPIYRFFAKKKLLHFHGLRFFNL